MKFFAAVLALATTAVAAPAAEVAAANPPHFVKDSVACACVDKRGYFTTGDLCHQNSGWTTRDLPAGLCYPHTPQASDMTKVFTDDVCKNLWGEYGWDKATCRPVKLCLEWPNVPEFKDLWVQCP